MQPASCFCLLLPNPTPCTYRIVRDMQSLSFTPGRAFLSVDSPIVPWTVVFEDEGIAGYFYACDRSQEKHEHSILDGTAQALYDFQARVGYCRMDFPNFLEERGDTWRKSSHAWSDAALQRFESALYV